MALTLSPAAMRPAAAPAGRIFISVVGVAPVVSTATIAEGHCILFGWPNLEEGSRLSIMSLDDLRQPDDRTLRFTPLGLSLGRQMRPEDAAEFQQQVVAQFELAPQVAEATRRSFEDLRTIFPQGLFCYEIFTLVNDRALLVLEQALRDRFVGYHRGTVTFVDPATNSRHAVQVGNYEHVQEALKAHRTWQLLLDNGQTLKFNGMLGGLRAWARQLGMLRGQRNRATEQALSNLRNLVAHPTGYHLVTPVDAARTLRDLAEIINHLWGELTPGGRLYPAPLRREVVVLAWDSAGARIYTALANQLSNAVDPTDQPWQCIILRAVFRPDQRIADPGLTEYDSRHEITNYPTELLWGPGTITDAAAWFDRHEPCPDESDYLDRTFAIRYDGSYLYLPMRVEVAASLPTTDHPGNWYVIKADHPNDAYAHVRNLLVGTGCVKRGECTNCTAETVSVGRHQDAVASMSDRTTPLPPDVATPWAPPRFHTIT